jgi:D-3-phosphoglycerate dehydrogenase
VIGASVIRAILVEYPPYGPWDVETEAMRRVGGRLEVVSHEQFAAAPSDGEVVLNAAAGALSAPLLDQLPSLRCAVSYGVGLDWLDVADATRRGIMVVNMPLANVEDVATHSFALILACSRRLLELDRSVRGGVFDWPRSAPLHRLRGRTLGLLAFGNIARAVARLAIPFGLSVSAYDPYVDPETMRVLGVEPSELEPLLTTSHIVSVHLPSRPETRGFLDGPRLDLLRRGAIVVVTSRGDVYDPDALLLAASDGRIAAAGLDVFPDEPLPPDHPLTQAPNIVLTPHVAGYSEESIRDMHATAARIVTAVANGARPPGLVNQEVLG